LALIFALAQLAPATADDWPQCRGPERDGVWRESGVVAKLPAKANYRWRMAIGGGFAGPAVAGGRVYVCDRVPAKGQAEPVNLWNRRDPVEGLERVLCLDAASGRILWQHEYACRYTISYPAGPRATPTVCQGKVYTLGAMGDLRCLDAQDGKLIWSKNYVRDFGLTMNPWGMAAAPLVDGPRLIVLPGGKDSAGVMALDCRTGAEIWRALDLPDPGYSAPMIVACGGVRQLLVWAPTGLYGMDPASGKVFWREPADVKMAHTIASPAFDPQRRLVFVTSFFNGPMMVRLDAASPLATLLWKGSSQSELPNRTEGLHGLMSTPVFRDGFLYGVCSYGKLRCLEAETGRRVWETLAPVGESRWATAFLTPHEDRFFLFTERGELILARLSPKGYEELGRMPIVEPTMKAGRRMVVWSPPAFAGRCMFARNDKEIVCVDLAERGAGKQ
jgi:outer membrane protein assembly factor BamB